MRVGLCVGEELTVFGALIAVLASHCEEGICSEQGQNCLHPFLFTVALREGFSVSHEAIDDDSQRPDIGGRSEMVGAKQQLRRLVALSSSPFI